MKYYISLFIILPSFAFAQMSKTYFNLSFEDKPEDLSSWYASYSLSVASHATELGYDVNDVMYLTPENYEKIRFGTLPKGTLAVAKAVYDDCKVDIVINRAEWFNTPQLRRMWIYYHEMAHDTFNLDHGEGGELMNAFAPSERITSMRLYNAIRDMVHYAIRYGRYEKGGYCKNGKKFYVNQNKVRPNANYGNYESKSEDHVSNGKAKKTSTYSSRSKNNSINKLDEIRKLSNSALEKYNNGDLDGAIEDSNKAISIDKSMLKSERRTFISDQTYANRGFYLSKKNEIDKALEDYNTAIEMNPGNIFAHHYRGTIKQFKKDYYGAISDYSTAYNLNKEDDKYGSNLNQSKVKLLLGDSEGAILGYKASLDRYPKGSLSSLYVIFKDLGRTEELKEIGDKIMSLPVYKDQLTVLDDLLYEESINQNHDQIINICNKMLSIANNLNIEESQIEKQYELYSKIAMSNALLEDYYDGISAFSKAFELNPISKNILLRGSIKFRLGDINGACSDWNKGIQIDDDDVDLKNKYLKVIEENCKK